MLRHCQLALIWQYRDETKKQRTMKQIISTLAIAGITVMASCSTSTVRQQEAALKAQQQTIDSMEIALAKQQVIDSMNEVIAKKEESAKAVAYTAPVAKKVKRSTPRRSQSYAQSSVGSYTGNSTQTQPVVYQEVPAQPEKRGWSAKAKGAVIGTAVGAGAGAIINKRNRTAGAIIGGVLGAGAGTGIGAIIDKKNGR